MTSRTTVKSHIVRREMVLIGEDADPRRRGEKQVFAVSQCRFQCSDDATLARCVEAIRASDEHLRNRPEEMMLWDWQTTFVETSMEDDAEGGTVLLGVAWYDGGFFQEKRDTYLGLAHSNMYEGIGLTKEEIAVSHWLLVR